MMEQEKQKARELGLEPEVVFNTLSDLTVLAIQTEDTHESLMEITGYGIDIKFNRDKIHSLADVESLLDGVKDLFRELIMKDLIGTPESNAQKQTPDE